MVSEIRGNQADPQSLVRIPVIVKTGLQVGRGEVGLGPCDMFRLGGFRGNGRVIKEMQEQITVKMWGIRTQFEGFAKRRDSLLRLSHESQKIAKIVPGFGKIGIEPYGFEIVAKSLVFAAHGLM